MPADAAQFLVAAERAADAAGIVLRRHFRTGLNPALKPDQSPVTAADHEAEHALRQVLAAHHPSHGMIGEETGTIGPDSRYRWVLDPIDGTRAFLTGRPSFATLIALLDHGTPILGVIDQPISGERWVGCARQPTRFTGRFGTIGTRRGQALSGCELSCTSPQMFAESEAAGFARLAHMVARTSYGGDAYGYGLLALGQIDIVAEAGMKLWDWAALAPVVQGAGGSLTDWDGAPLRESGDGTVLALADAALLAIVVPLLRG